MPPKGKKGKLEKNKSKEKQEIVRPSEKEIVLQTELDNKVKELAEIKLRAHAFEEENHWLNEEAKKIRIEMDEYMHFMSKKTNLRQTKIVTLTDYHRKEIEDINRDKENMLKEYKQKKEELRLQIIEKGQLLIQVKNDLEAMNEYKLIQEQQNNEIKRLQNEITQIRSQHVSGISRMKLTHAEELQQQRTIENAKIEEIRQQADQEAEQFLYDQTLNIQNENVELRKALQDMLKRTQLLNDLKQRLEEEQLHLINRIKLTADLRKIRLDKVSTNIPEDLS
ncbi:unnamed protein product [Rotaria sordida]|uniref:DUF4515 domain-containing protein n=1 Tax=Rotaria sordida TaxID=392033 RepID=A0A814DJ05_9BILA|nr:unnamed protein product [Rotaria sordida]CAF0880256.1 unnamed protein product [Rotaria sordida]CAF0957761.1 unnamed protein product [Rotaria sordida]CAF1036719.1 unnamed protein product [Rotaria sordida]CAF1041272.1 unnamed protein product [Rotaria sordida]